MNRSKYLVFLILTVLLGIAHHAPFLNFQSAFAVGDHGFNIYAFERTALGDMPYRDFWWCYGPLAPYYYAAFIKMLGSTISSVLTGQALLSFLAGLFCFLTVARVASPLLALTTTMFYWAYFPDFFYSYNHTGGISLFMVITYLLFSYFQQPRRRYVYTGFICLFLLCLIRINMGLALLFGFVTVLMITDRVYDRDVKQKNTRLYLFGAGAVIFVSGLIYWWMLHPLPGYAIQQCMPYFNKTYHAESAPNPLFKYQMYLGYIKGLIQNRSMFLIILLLLLICTARTIVLMWTTPVDRSRKDPLHFSIFVILFLTGLVAHEFILGAHVYRVNWTIPYQMIFFALTIHFATRKMKPSWQHILVSCLLLGVLMDLFNYYGRINNTYKKREYFIHTPKAKIYVGNRQPYIRTIENVSLYLYENLKENESFFALPYEPLYYYLADRKSPSWHVLMMKGSAITAEQEQEMIAAIKDPRIKYVLLSNRYRYTSELRMGELGTTHLMDLSAYINNHFQTETTIGEWDAEAGWNFNHGVKILKRLPPGVTNN